MATPYLHVRLKSVASTQDEARARLDDLPVVVMAETQTQGRGRSGSEWLNADRALAASVAMHLPESDQRPFSLMAAVAAGRTLDGVSLKWPNDLLLDGTKVGGILVERSGEELVIGIGVNLWWADPPADMGSLYDDDPGPDGYAEIAGLWAAHLMALIDTDDWPRPEYLGLCDTLGKEITWDPGGSGTAVDVADDGGLVVESDGDRATLYSGAVRYVR